MVLFLLLVILVCLHVNFDFTFDVDGVVQHFTRIRNLEIIGIGMYVKAKL